MSDSENADQEISTAGWEYPAQAPIDTHRGHAPALNTFARTFKLVVTVLQWTYVTAAVYHGFLLFWELKKSGAGGVATLETLVTIHFWVEHILCVTMIAILEPILCFLWILGWLI